MMKNPSHFFPEQERVDSVEHLRFGREMYSVDLRDETRPLFSGMRDARARVRRLACATVHV